MARLIMIHGWGYDATFWDPLIEALAHKNCVTVDLGYFYQGGLKTMPKIHDSDVFVTHSLGTLWALKHFAPIIKTMFAFNSFTDFTSFTGTDRLLAMKQGIQKKAETQLKQFWRMCGQSPSSKPEFFHKARLIEGLNQLETWSFLELIKSHAFQLRLIQAKDDKIVPLAASTKMWQKQKVQYVQSGGHCLPQSRADECAELVRLYLSELNSFHGST